MTQPPHRQIRAILTDLDNTLYEYAPCNDAGIDAVVETAAQILCIGRFEIAESYNRGRDAVKEQFNAVGRPDVAAAHSRLLYIQRMVEELTRESKPTLVLRLHDAFWNAYMKRMVLRPGVYEFLTAAQNTRTPVIVVSDLTADIQHRKMLYLGIENLVTYIVTSEEAGVEKPHPAIFELALRKAGCKPEECIYFGDDNKRDCGGAESAGIPYVNATVDGVFEEYAKILRRMHT